MCSIFSRKQDKKRKNKFSIYTQEVLSTMKLFQLIVQIIYTNTIQKYKHKYTNTNTIQKYKHNTKIQTQYTNTIQYTIQKYKHKYKHNTQTSIFSLCCPFGSVILLSETESFALFIFSVKGFDVQDVQFLVSMEITV